MRNIADYTSPQFLTEHIQKTMAFYHPRCVDPSGGFHQYFLDDGSIYNFQERHLVSSCRFVFNYAMAAVELECPEYLPQVEHGIDYLEQIHKNRQTSGYAWLLKDNQSIDDTNHCYGLAFVLLSHAMAVKAGFGQSREYIEQTWQLLEKHFWDQKHQLYCDEFNHDFSEKSDYRGQNANMHMCEAMLMTYEATSDQKFLIRAYTLAFNICMRQAGLADGLIWEHYHPDWQIDWNYNLDNPKHLFRPWGFQPGHLTEWAKLLLILHRHQPQDWMISRAESLFNSAMDKAWDHRYGGICYGFAPSGEICDGDKYFWVQAESFAAAALLAIATGKDQYWEWYNKIWHYAWTHMVDHKYGGWYRILTRDNHKYSNEKSPAGKTDYHTMGACYEVIRALRLEENKS